MVENTKHRQILKKVSMPHRELHTLSYTEAPFRCSHTFFKHTNKRFCFAINNAAVVALFGHIALDGTPQRPAPETLQSLWKPFGG